MTYRNLAEHIARKAFILQFNQELEAATKRLLAEGPRNHLGASIIGRDCQAFSWSTFRWLKGEDFSGQMLRLFNRGHKEEPRLVAWLVGMGFEVRELDPATQKQYRIVGAKGHFGGSLDAIVKVPELFNLSPTDSVMLGEFKTHNDKSFNKLKKEGVRRAKPEHFRQMSCYGRAYGLKYGLYLAVNKNDDEIWPEIVELDYLVADDLFRKADAIVNSQVRPPKIANTATFFDCQYCHYSPLCHNGEAPEKNCRSCRNAFAVENAEWFCQVHNAVIPAHIIPAGCDSYGRIV